MKKVLLSLSLLAATLFANAQQFTLWNSTFGFSQIVGAPFNNTTTPPPIANPAVNTGVFFDTTVVAGLHTIQATGSENTGSYYIGGAGIGQYSAPNTGQPWTGLYSVIKNGTFANTKLYFKAMYTGTAPSITFQFTANNDTATFAYQIDLSAANPTAGSYYTYSIPLSAFNATVKPAYTLTGYALTGAKADSIFKFGVSVSPGTGTGTGAAPSGSAAFSMTDVWIGSSATFLGTTAQAASNISSAVLYPNPISNGGQVLLNISLANQSTVTTIVTDMMGKQITSLTVPTAVGNTTTNLPVFNTAGLAKGMYTVTYVIDGTPAKTELVAVQ